MRLVDQNHKITLKELKEQAHQTFGDLVKAVVDTKRELMVVGGGLHADEEAFLLERGSQQDNLWGINLYPDLPSEKWIEFDSVVNVRPGQGNPSRYVEDPKIREKITAIVNKLVER